ncbi:unnamed protein product [Lampetra fluviatilis]
MCISPHARVHHIAAANVPEKVVLVLSCTGNHSIEMAGAACDTTQREPPQGQLASIVVENYTIANVTAVLTNSDCKLECQVLATLDQLSKHSVELVVLVAQVFPETLSGLHKPGEFVQIVKRSAKDQHELRAHAGAQCVQQGQRRCCMSPVQQPMGRRATPPRAARNVEVGSVGSQ